MMEKHVLEPQVVSNHFRSSTMQFDSDFVKTIKLIDKFSRFLIDVWQRHSLSCFFVVLSESKKNEDGGSSVLTKMFLK